MLLCKGPLLTAFMCCLVVCLHQIFGPVSKGCVMRCVWTVAHFQLDSGAPLTASLWSSIHKLSVRVVGKATWCRQQQVALCICVSRNTLLRDAFLVALHQACSPYDLHRTSHANILHSKRRVQHSAFMRMGQRGYLLSKTQSFLNQAIPECKSLVTSTAIGKSNDS